MKRIIFIMFVIMLTSGCVSLKPIITEGKIIKKDIRVEILTTGFPEFGQPSAVIINTHYYIVISNGVHKQKVKVTPEEFEGLQIGWTVDVSKKYK